jgi:hypothetical protein
VKSRTLLIGGLLLLLAAGILAALATGSSVESQTVTLNGKTMTITKLTPKPGHVRTVTVNGVTRTVRVPVGPPSVRTVRPPAVGSTRTVTTTHVVTTPGPTHVVATTVHQTQTVVHSVTTTVPGGTRTVVATVTVPGMPNTVTVTETVTVKPGGGPCPPRNPHC